MPDRNRILFLLISLAMLMHGQGVLALEISASLMAPLAGQSSSFSYDDPSRHYYEISSASQQSPVADLQIQLNDHSRVGVSLGRLHGNQLGSVPFGFFNLPATGTWQFDRLASWYERDLTMPPLRTSLRVGLNVFDGKMSAQIAPPMLETYSIQVIIPVPLIGLSLRVPLNERWAIGGHHDRSALHVAGNRMDMAETRIELQYQWSPAITAALGYRRHRLDLSYAHDDIQAALAVKLNTPYLLATYIF